jgi:acyl-CoA synthetase (AMP-forming)/AMP-acid ligase II
VAWPKENVLYLFPSLSGGDHGLEAAIGQPGELVGRAPTMMNGYHKRPEATQELVWEDANGRTFYRAGDLAMLDEDGFVTLLGRSRDLIISGGLNIYPSDLEEVLASHPDVAEAAVVGIPSPQWGETPLGLVVLHQAAQLSAEALRDWTNARLAKTQRLSGVEFRRDLPRNEIGKVLKTTLRSPYWSGTH